MAGGSSHHGGTFNSKMALVHCIETNITLLC